MSAAAWTPEERRRRGTELCRRLATDVAAICPPGIGTWDRAWDIVADADATFFAELVRWEASPSEPARVRVREAYNGVVDAWRGAAAQYIARGQRSRR